MRALLLLNPHATSTDKRLAEDVLARMRADLDVEVAPTKARGHAVHLAAGAVHSSLDAVFAIGGDGTANEVLQPLAGTDVALGLLPGGGGNVLARGLGLPRDPRTALEVQLAALREGRSRRITLGRAADRWFAFQAGFGYDAAVVREIESSPDVKRHLRQAGFVLLAVREWISGPDRRDPAVSVRHPGGASGPHALVVVANGSPYTYLGPWPLRVTPQARYEGGLDVCTIDALSVAGLVRTVWRAFRRADHARDPGVSLHADLTRLELRASRPTPLMLDGDYVGEHQQVEFTAAPEALRTLAPTAPT